MALIFPFLIGLERSYLKPLAIADISLAQEKSLHNLHNLAKQTRYNLELFEPFYCPRYHQHAQEIREVQTILGEIQDYFVLNQTLSKLPKASLASKMPIISQLLQAQRPKAWQQWQNKQALFLNQAHRLELRKTVKYPLLITPLS